jgi:hypothetical protein
MLIDITQSKLNYILWHVDPLLGNDRETNRQRPVNSNKGMAFSAPMAARATMDAATEERCFLCGPCLEVISRTSSERQCSAAQGSEELVGDFAVRNR